MSSYLIKAPKNKPFLMKTYKCPTRILLDRYSKHPLA